MKLHARGVFAVAVLACLATVPGRAQEGSAPVVFRSTVDIVSVAAVVRDRGGAPVAAVHAHGPSYRFPGERSPDEIGKLVAATGERVSERIAW